MSEDAQMRLKTGATKGGLTKSDGSHPEPSEEDVKSKGGMSEDAQVIGHVSLSHMTFGDVSVDADGQVIVIGTVLGIVSAIAVAWHSSTFPQCDLETMFALFVSVILAAFTFQSFLACGE